jgi:hypothetical protein
MESDFIVRYIFELAVHNPWIRINIKLINKINLILIYVIKFAKTNARFLLRALYTNIKNFN